MNPLEPLLSLVPAPPLWQIDWRAAEQWLTEKTVTALSETRQDPRYHAEGDVYTHTRLVVQALCEMDRFRELTERKRAELFFAALLHDVGKPQTTIISSDAITSPGHAPTGARIARRRLYADHGICGTTDLLNFRETVCNLINYHTFPVHALNDENNERMLRIAAQGELIPDFNLDLLCILAEADIRGRHSEHVTAHIESVELCRELARDTGCLCSPYTFASVVTQHALLNGRRLWRDQIMPDTSWGEVVMLAGLPAAGKDTWIARNLTGLPVISLDELREKYHVSPLDRQTAIGRLAQEQARAFLRRQEPFVWNATNISVTIRRTLLRLFESYGARVRIIYLETSPENQQSRNANRTHVVPQSAIDIMIARLTPPARHEATHVQWICN